MRGGGRHGRGRDRDRQDGTAGLPPRRRRHRPQPPHPRPRGRRRLLRDRRLPVRGPRARPRPPTASRRRPPPSSWAASARRACSTSRGCGPATTTPSRSSTRSPACPTAKATPRLQEIYAEPVKPELIGAAHRRDQGRRGHLRGGRDAAPHARAGRGRAARPSPTCSSSRPPSCRPSTWPARSSRSTSRRSSATTSCRCSWAAARRTRRRCTSCARARPGCWWGPGPAPRRVTREVLGVGVPLATALADARAARMRHLDETGVYCHVIADGGITTGRRHRPGGGVRRRRRDDRHPVRRRRRGAGARLALEHARGARHAAPRRAGAGRAAAARSSRSCTARPTTPSGGQPIGALRRAMALCGYETLKDLQKAELVVVPDRTVTGGPRRRGRGHRQRPTRCPTSSTPAWSSTSAPSTPSSSPGGCARRTSTPRSCPTRSPPPRSASDGPRR